MNIDKAKPKANPEAVRKKNIDTLKSISELLAGEKTERMIQKKAKRAAATRRRKEERDIRQQERLQRQKRRQRSADDEQKNDKRESICEGLSCTVQLQMGLSKHLGQPLMW